MMAGSLEVLPPVELSRLDDIDKMVRNTAKRAGHSHPIASFHAKRAKVRATPDINPCVAEAPASFSPKRRRLYHKQNVLTDMV